MAFKPFFKKSKNGVTKIVRATYGKPSDWYALTKEVKKRDGHKCLFCGKPESSKEGVYHDVHHIKELSKGGTNAKANLATTCKVCHKRRHRHMR